MLTTYLFARRRTGRLHAFLIALGAQLKRMREERRAVIELSHLSDHQLRDIGISRAEIDHAVQHGRDRFQ
ncbi:DUF1127 domain-containing protein [Dongia rigui]|uniref:DUF1127 domain-containing protein n=1 Tax=Dongia rigui TaxID=940149 RepID=A0ABU5E472_9PROT|nr:DUF1127 domain-containing protein [Dongia rigui]MDY0873994.1 DUF1127 domain-containing protein [Dongia rigui]